jgi:hypothetical protein
LIISNRDDANPFNEIAINRWVAVRIVELALRPNEPQLSEVWVDWEVSGGRELPCRILRATSSGMSSMNLRSARPDGLITDRQFTVVGFLLTARNLYPAWGRFGSDQNGVHHY